VTPRLRCPTCQRAIEWSDQFPYRPFCSERCRLIDLGAWLSEKHAIPGHPSEGPDESAVGSNEQRSNEPREQ
jgi:endogenous inhibitor of DNA gyrase (YacG/DUF329 family)